jgi:hypothetical protein
MDHVITRPNGRDLVFGCSCGDRFATQKLADKHAEDQNLIEENEAKAEAAKSEDAAERVDPTEPEATQAAVAAPPAPPTPERPAKPTPAPTAAQPPAKAQPAATPGSLGPSSLPLDLNHMSSVTVVNKATGEYIELDYNSFEDFAMQYDEVTQQIAALERAKKKMGEELKLMMGDERELPSQTAGTSPSTRPPERATPLPA